MKEVIDTLKKQFPQFQYPSTDLQSGFDNSKIQKVLGMTFVDRDESIVAAVQDMVKKGQVKPL
jgi:hypothetical protein